MKLYAVILGALVACALSLPLDEAVNVYDPSIAYADDAVVRAPTDEVLRPKRGLLLGAGAGLLGAAALGAGAVGLGGAVLGAKAGFIGGALAGSAFRPRSYGGYYGGYGGHGGYYGGYGGGYGGGYYGYGHGYRSYPTYVVSDPWC